MKIKILAVLLVLLVIANLVAYIVGIVSGLFFWILTAIIAFIAFKIIPKARRL